MDVTKPDNKRRRSVNTNLVGFNPVMSDDKKSLTAAIR